MARTAQTTNNALQQRDISDLKAAFLQHIEDDKKFFERFEGKIDEGFAGVHSRQDTTNGRITKGEAELGLLKGQIEANEKLHAEREKSRVRPWQVLTVLLPIIVALATYIIYRS